MKRNKMNRIISFILFFFTLLLIQTTIWIPKNFGEVSIHQIIFHLKVPLEGADNSFFISYFLWCILIPLCLSLCISFILFGRSKIRFLHEIIIIRSDRKISFNIIELVRNRIILISVIVALLAGQYAFTNIGVYGYIYDISHPSTLYEDYYVEPMEVSYTFPEKKRNLIYIYIESMEITYQNKELGGAMDVDLIPELTELAKEGVTFYGGEPKYNGFQVPSGTGWTIGAMTGHSAGIPLKIPIEGNSYNDETKFLPGSHMIGDILHDHGYNQELFIGSDAVFGGRKNLYVQHGDFEIIDYHSAIEKELIPDDYYVWWGYEDQKLYDFAMNELSELAMKEEPFNFTMLTTDTHHVGGYRCPKCPDTYESQYENVIACASKQAAEFVRWIQEQAFYENTTIVLTGDHLSMDPNFFENLDDDYLRKGYFTILNSAIPLTNEKPRQYTTLDLFPTTLASLGVRFNSDRLALGTNLFANIQTLSEEIGFEELNSQIDRTSNFYNNKLLYGK